LGPGIFRVKVLVNGKKPDQCSVRPCIDGIHSYVQEYRRVSGINKISAFGGDGIFQRNPFPTEFKPDTACTGVRTFHVKLITLVKGVGVSGPYIEVLPINQDNGKPTLFIHGSGCRRDCVTDIDQEKKEDQKGKKEDGEKLHSPIFASLRPSPKLI
jgi:hypothetical protein